MKTSNLTGVEEVAAASELQFSQVSPSWEIHKDISESLALWILSVVRMIDEVRKPIDSECYIPPSEPFG
jgi:hypothetical protein